MAPLTAVAPPAVAAEARSRRRRLKMAPANLCLHGHVAPTLLLIGCQKCGTTSLWNDMHDHIEGTVPAQPWSDEQHYFNKEQHFFDKETRFSRGLQFYVRHYPTCPPRGQAMYAMDATPEYMRYPGTAKRVHLAYAGHTRALRIITIVRSPTERVRSWYDHLGTLGGRARATLDHWVEAMVRRMRECAAKHGVDAKGSELWASPCRELGPGYGDALSGGLYAPQLAEWLRWFPANQIALVTFGGYVQQTDKVIADIAQFVRGGHVGGEYGPAPRIVNRRLQQRLGAHVPRESDIRSGRANATAAAPARRRAIEAAHANKKRHHTLGAHARATLEDFYRPHNAAFVALLHRPASRAVRTTPVSPASALTLKSLFSH